MSEHDRSNTVPADPPEPDDYLLRVRLSPDHHAALERLAERERESLSVTVRRLIIDAAKKQGMIR